MEKNFRIPDELARRLEGREAELPEILEAGLRRLELWENDAETLDGEPVDGDHDDGARLPAAWDAALVELMRRKQATTRSPTPEEIVDFGQDRAPAGDGAWLDRLTADREAVRDLVDFMEFQRPDTDTDGQTDAEVAAETAAETAAAWQRFRGELEPTAAVSRSLRWLPLAAALVLACGLAWAVMVMDRSPDVTDPRHATVLDVSTSRGARSFPISSADRVLLLIPSEEGSGATSTTDSARRLRISRVGGEVIYRGEYRALAAERGRLYVELSRELLVPGSYLVEILADSEDREPVPIRQYRFSIDGAGPD